MVRTLHTTYIQRSAGGGTCTTVIRARRGAVYVTVRIRVSCAMSAGAFRSSVAAAAGTAGRAASTGVSHVSSVFSNRLLPLRPVLSAPSCSRARCSSVAGAADRQRQEGLFPHEGFSHYHPPNTSRSCLPWLFTQGQGRGFAAAAASASASSSPGLFEMRTYVVKPEHLTDYLRRCADAVDVRKRLNPGFLGFWINELGGDVNEVTHLYHFSDYDHRDATRQSMGQDPEWKAFLAATKPALVSQKSEVFLPATAALVGQPGVLSVCVRCAISLSRTYACMLHVW